MNLDQIFQSANLIAIAGWVALVFLPMWRGSQLVAAVIIPGLLAIAYLLMIAMSLGNDTSMDFSTLDGIRALFSNDQALVIGWIHYLAFDLFVGAWEARDAKRLGIPHLLLIPCLALTFMFGPVGFLLYMVIRSVRTRGLSLASV